MSILIKGMKMPENCGECQLCYDYIDCMAASNTIRINFETRPKECPLVEVPPHGRLIDAENLYYNLVNEPIKSVAGILFDADLYTKIADAYIQAINTVAQSPTIIEAEGEKKDG